MAVPKKKLSRTRTRRRRSHLSLDKISLAACPNCGEKKVTHRVCENCGNYNGDKVNAFKDEKNKDNK